MLSTEEGILFIVLKLICLLLQLQRIRNAVERRCATNGIRQYVSPIGKIRLASLTEHCQLVLLAVIEHGLHHLDAAGRSILQRTNLPKVK
jgi:hypothetical protein